jgi:cytochrome c-type biogenesis protein CcmH
VRALALSVFIGLAASAVAQETAPDAAPQEDPRDVVGAPRGRKLAGAELVTRTEEVGGLLRCPVCQGLSVADSPATMATNMKARVRELLAEGYDEEQILAYFERSYGEFVRLEPPRRGINWLVWLAPPAAFLGGVALLARTMKRRRPGPREAGTTSPEPAVDDPELAPYVLRVRELAYGWPGGKPPADAA